jgi:hypothetical protein
VLHLADHAEPRPLLAIQAREGAITIRGLPDPAPSGRSYPIREDERDVIDVAVGPILARLDRRDDRMFAFTSVLGCVLVGRGITAANVPATATHSQVHPRPADREAVFAPSNLCWPGDGYLVEVRAGGHHPTSLPRPSACG